VFAGEAFNISNNKTSWGQDCQLASPNLKYSDNERVLQLNKDDLSGLNVPEEGLWIGFAKAFAAFTYIGESYCMLENELSSPLPGMQIILECH